MSDDELEDLINNIADDFDAPGVEHIHAIAASRKQKRQVATKVGGVAAIVLLIAGLGFWVTRPDPTELATGDDAASSSVADDSAPVEFDDWDSIPLVQRRLINTNRWFVTSRQGIPESSHPGGERVSFSDNMIAFSNCEWIIYDITWTQDGFTVERQTPKDPNAEVTLEGCEDPIDGVFLTPMPSGLEVKVVANADRTISLTSSEWQLTLSAMGPRDDDTRIYISLPLEEAAALAEANGLEWRVVHIDGEDQRIDAALKPERLNFTTQGGIVIHVRSDAELAALSGAETTTTTTIVQSADLYVSLPIEDAGALADANGEDWRVITLDGVPQLHQQDIRPNRLNFTVVDGLVVSVQTDSQMYDSPDMDATDAPLALLGDALALGDDQPIHRSHFYLTDHDGQPEYSGAERNPIFVVDVRLWRQDDGSEVIEIQFNNERVDGGGQCGTYRSGMLVERQDGLVEFREGEYPTVDGHGFGVEDGAECGSIEPVDFAPIFEEPFQISDVTTSGFTITNPNGESNPFRLLDPDNPPATPQPG